MCDTMRLQLLKTLFLLPLLGLAFAAVGEKRELSWTDPTDNSYKIVTVKAGEATTTFATATALTNQPAQVEATHNVFVVVKVENAGKEIKTVTVDGATPEKVADATLGAGEELWKFTMPDANVAIAVTLQAKKFALKWTAPTWEGIQAGDLTMTVKANGSDVTTNTPVEAGATIEVSVTFKAELEKTKKVDAITLGALPMLWNATNKTYIANMPPAETEIKVTVASLAELSWTTPADNSYTVVKVKAGDATTTFATATDLTASPSLVKVADNVFVVLKVEDAGKEIKTVTVAGATPAKVEGETLGAGEELWKFTMPAAAASVEVTLQAKNFPLKWTAPTWDGIQAGDLTMTVKANGSDVTTNTPVAAGAPIAVSLVLKDGLETTKKIASVTLGETAMVWNEADKTYTANMPAKEAEIVVTVADRVNKVTFASVDKLYKIAMVSPQESKESVNVTEGEKVAMKIELAKLVVLDNRQIEKVIATKEGETGEGATIELVLDEITGYYTFTMPDKPVTITVKVSEIPTLTFAGKDKEYTIVAKSSFGSLIIRSGNKVNYQLEVALIVTPSKELKDAKKQVVAVLLNKTNGGDLVTRATRSSNDNEWLFSMPNEDVTVEVKIGAIEKKTFTFADEADKYQVVAKVGKDQLASPAEVTVAERVTLTITPDEKLLKSGKRIAKVTIGDAIARKESLANLWSFTMPERDAELKVEYEDINYRKLEFTPSTDDYDLNVLTGPSPLIKVDPENKQVEPGREITIGVILKDAAKSAGKVLREVRAFTGEGVEEQALTVKLEEITKTWSFTMPNADARVEIVLGIARQLRFTSVADKYSVKATHRGKELIGPFVKIASGETLEFVIEVEGEAKKAGRTVQEVKLGDKVAVQKGDKWVVEMPDADAKLEVTMTGTEPTKKLTFAPVAELYSITAMVNGAAVTSPADVVAGSKVELSIEPVGQALAAGRTIQSVSVGTALPVQNGKVWAFDMPNEDVTVAVTLSDVPAPTVSLTVVKGEGVEGAVVYTTDPATLTGLAQKSQVTFHVTRVPEGKVLKIVGNEKVAGVRELIPNQEYIVALGTENATVTLSLEAAIAPNQYFNITIEAKGADVAITADGVTTDGKNVKKDAVLVFTVTPAKDTKIDAVTFDGQPLAANQQGKYETTMTNYDAKFVVKTSKVEKPEPPKAVEDALLASVRIAPNPFSTRLVVENQNLVAGTYELVSVVGKVVCAGVWETTELHIATENLPQGIYLLRLTTERGAQKVFRVLKR